MAVPTDPVLDRWRSELADCADRLERMIDDGTVEMNPDRVRYLLIGGALATPVVNDKERIFRLLDDVLHIDNEELQRVAVFAIPRMYGPSEAVGRVAQVASDFRGSTLGDSDAIVVLGLFAENPRTARAAEVALSGIVREGDVDRAWAATASLVGRDDPPFGTFVALAGNQSIPGGCRDWILDRMSELARATEPATGLRAQWDQMTKAYDQLTSESDRTKLAEVIGLVGGASVLPAIASRHPDLVPSFTDDPVADLERVALRLLNRNEPGDATMALAALVRENRLSSRNVFAAVSGHVNATEAERELATSAFEGRILGNPTATDGLPASPEIALENGVEAALRELGREAGLSTRWTPAAEHLLSFAGNAGTPSWMRKQAIIELGDNASVIPSERLAEAIGDLQDLETLVIAAEALAKVEGRSLQLN